ncbi:MAG: type II toxin-antitoxin system VapC family toxin [Hyphomicrobiales bacterium]|nr:type II toxin-antitoxin system VapC family toxin [Hyphomicrobiales bacterium]
MFLVDTNVISVTAPSRPAPAELIGWMDAQSASLFLSTVTVAEIEDGIAKTRREGATRKSRNVAAWLRAVIHLYGDRILPFDTPAARIAGVLSDRARSQGQAPGLSDIIIAATAKHHGLVVLSRNTRHFAPLGVSVLDPYHVIPPA